MTIDCLLPKQCSALPCSLCLAPCCRDYMDRFIDEQENPVPPRDRSCSPSIHSLLYGDPKRHSHELRSPTEPVASEAEIVAAIELVKEVVPDWTHRLDFSPVKLHPELDGTVAPLGNAATTVAVVNTETRASQNPENLVYSANFTPVAPAPVDQRVEGTVTKVVQPAAVAGTDSASMPTGTGGDRQDLKHPNTCDTKDSVDDSGEPCRKRLKADQDDNPAENCVACSAGLPTSPLPPSSSVSVAVAESQPIAAPSPVAMVPSVLAAPAAGLPDSSTHSTQASQGPAAPDKSGTTECVSSSSTCAQSAASHTGHSPALSTANTSPCSSAPCPAPDTTFQNCGPTTTPSKSGGVALAIASVNSTAHGLGDASITAALSAEASKSPPLATAEPLAQ